MQTQFIDEKDPFIIEAHRKRGRNEECWCDSGKKYKNCHLQRELEKPVELGEALQINHAFFNTKRCMHPDQSKCSGKRIRAHTVQKNGSLKYLKNKNNLVLKMSYSHSGNRGPEEVGWNNASTFYGFCSSHDSETFKKIENENFTEDNEKLFLFYYRAVCYELYQKEALIKILELQKERLDKGKDLHRQIEIQYSLNHMIQGFKRTVEELQTEKIIADESLLGNSFDNYGHLILYLEGPLDLSTSSHMHLSYTIEGRQIYDLNDTNVFGEGASLSVFDVDEKTNAFIISWNNEYKKITQFIQDLLLYDRTAIINSLHQLLFAQSENIYFSDSWWESISEDKQQYVCQLFYQNDEDYSNYIYKDLQLHRWTVKDIKTINF